MSRPQTASTRHWFVPWPISTCSTANVRSRLVTYIYLVLRAQRVFRIKEYSQTVGLGANVRAQPAQATQLPTFLRHVKRRFSRCAHPPCPSQRRTRIEQRMLGRFSYVRSIYTALAVRQSWHTHSIASALPAHGGPSTYCTGDAEGIACGRSAILLTRRCLLPTHAPRGQQYAPHSSEMIPAHTHCHLGPSCAIWTQCNAGQTSLRWRAGNDAVTGGQTVGDRASDRAVCVDHATTRGCHWPHSAPDKHRVSLRIRARTEAFVAFRAQCAHAVHCRRREAGGIPVLSSERTFFAVVRDQHGFSRATQIDRQPGS